MLHKHHFCLCDITEICDPSMFIAECSVFKLSQICFLKILSKTLNLLESLIEITLRFQEKSHDLKYQPINTEILRQRHYLCESSWFFLRCCHIQQLIFKYCLIGR